jgi:hypothetical protein
MGFFDAPPPPLRMPPQPRRQDWMAPPEGWLGGFVPMRAVLARTAELAITLGPMEAFPTGVRLGLQIATRQLTRGPGPLIGMDNGGLRFGVAFADGSKWQGMRFDRPGFSGGSPPRPNVTFNGGGGGDNLYEQWLWLWPLPPPGPVTFAVSWPGGGIDEVTVELDGARFRAAAAEAEQLWEPLSSEEREAAIRERFESHRGSSSGVMFGISVGSSDPEHGDDEK